MPLLSREEILRVVQEAHGASVAEMERAKACAEDVFAFTKRYEPQKKFRGLKEIAKTIIGKTKKNDVSTVVSMLSLALATNNVHAFEVTTDPEVVARAATEFGVPGSQVAFKLKDKSGKWYWMPLSHCVPPLAWRVPPATTATTTLAQSKRF